jgi:hypothetical protein
MRVAVYVDGESHFERSLHQWRAIHGESAHLAEVRCQPNSRSSNEFPSQGGFTTTALPEIKFFWDSWYLFLAPEPLHQRSIDAAAYFTTFSGDDSSHHAACVALRGQRFDPQVIRERSQLAGRRADRLASHGIIEKAKGVDVAFGSRVGGWVPSSL